MTSKYSRVSGFNPRLIVWWVKGCRIPTPVTFPTRREATRARQDLYALRNAMRKEGHHAVLLIERGEIIRRPVLWDHNGADDPHTLTVRPAGFDMNEALDSAGIGMPGEGDENGGKPFDGAIPSTLPKAPIPFDYANAMGEDPEGAYAGAIKEDTKDSNE